MHVNSIWQRLRQNLLLFLQVLAVLLLILACFNPGCQDEKLSGDRFIFVIDNSSSMSTTDVDESPTRLEEAKRRALQLVDRMKNGDSAMVISFSDRAFVQQSYTQNHPLLKRKINEIQPTQRGSDLNEALIAAAGINDPNLISDRLSEADDSSGSELRVDQSPQATLFILTDGAVRELPADFLPGNLAPEYRPIGGYNVPENVGIVAFSVNDQLESDQQIQIFARLENFGLTDRQVSLELRVNDQLTDARQGVAVPAGEGVSLNFDLSDLASRLTEPTAVRLAIEEADDYLIDNVAYCVLNPPRASNVLIVTDYNPYLRLVTQTEHVSKIANIQFEDRDYLDSQEYQQRSTLGFYDLIIFDQCAPVSAPQCNTVYWGAIPTNSDWRVIEELAVTTLIDVDGAHPLMFAIGLGDVLIAQSRLLSGPTGAIPLAQSLNGPAMMIAPRGSYEDLVIGFPLIEYDADGNTNINSDWPRKLSFPLFTQNILTYLGGASRFSFSRPFQTGEVISLKMALPYPSIVIRLPDGRNVPLDVRSDGTFVFSETDQIGIYEVSPAGSNQIEQRFAVNLLDRLESDLRVRDELQLGYVEVAATRGMEKNRSDYWPWIVLAVLAIILLEWHIYNRRVLL